MTAKRCRDCKGEFPLSQFFSYARGDHRYHDSYCKSCKIARRRAWGQQNPEQLKALEASSRANRREVLRQRNSAYYAANREAVIANAQRWQTENPERRRLIDATKSKVRHALRRGDLVRAAACEECGATGVFIEAAHADYSQPFAVRWLCRPCHRTWDHAQPKTVGGYDGE